jgi:phosphoribosylaminoimidazolecarboxamide formyltransferase / IMP cyclohydrolase
MLDGRVKTLHPKIHAGVLALRDDASHTSALEAYDIGFIDLVVVNLYPFEATISREGVSFDEAIENIDIGGPTMLRAAAKNYRHVAAIVDPADYAVVLDDLDSSEGISRVHCAEFAYKVFAHTARYDTLIADYLGTRDADFPEQFGMAFKAAQPLRYGENPHQKAFFYKEFREQACSTAANLKQLHGKELSFNNIIDLSAALDLCREFADEKFCCVLKHTNPCGAALGSTALEAFSRAWATDPVSAFGGIIGFTTEVDAATAEEIGKYFVEIVAAPSYSADALALLMAKKNLRVMQMDKPLVPYAPGWDLKKVSGGLLVQETDTAMAGRKDLQVVSRRQPEKGELDALLFAWKICKYIKSNAICYTSDTQLLGVGAGQMSRVDSAKFGAMKSQQPLEGSYLASDAFFPFRDGVDAAAEAGVKAIIQPGGSVRDQEVIDACDEHGLLMVYTGQRHFRH